MHIWDRAEEEEEEEALVGGAPVWKTGRCLSSARRPCWLISLRLSSGKRENVKHLRCLESSGKVQKKMKTDLRPLRRLASPACSSSPSYPCRSSYRSTTTKKTRTVTSSQGSRVTSSQGSKVTSRVTSYQVFLHLLPQGGELSEAEFPVSTFLLLSSGT